MKNGKSARPIYIPGSGKPLKLNNDDFNHRKACKKAERQKDRREFINEYKEIWE